MYDIKQLSFSAKWRTINTLFYLTLISLSLSMYKLGNFTENDSQESEYV